MAIKAVAYQSFADMVVQGYGTMNAFEQLLKDNVTESSLELSDVLAVGRLFNVDIELNVADKKALQQMDGAFVMTHRKLINQNISSIVEEDGSTTILSEDGTSILIKE